MYIVIALVFAIGYAFIALEHPLRINKAASSILMAVFLWTLLIVGGEALVELPAGMNAVTAIEAHLMEHLSDIGGILFFLLGAMTIVEIVDSHGGFEIITRYIHTTSQSKLLWILSITTFFMSAALDNMTTAIVMSTLLRKLVKDDHDIWFFGGMIIIAANAGGAWSPIGDVTTIMLWIGGQITAANIVLKLFIPSLMCLIIPLIIISLRRKGTIEKPVNTAQFTESNGISSREKSIVFYLGTGVLLFVPIFKTITHLPPFMGILLGVGLLWVVTEIMHRHKDDERRKPLSISGVLQRIDTPSILFFLGILLAVAALETAGHLGDLATSLNNNIGNIWAINTLIGLLSAVVDNVPLVAGAMGMYNLTDFPPDHPFWELLAYCAGTGGSILIIGSAAGVATMGILKIEFIWYMKKIALWAAIGYFAGILSYYVLEHVMF